MLTVELCRRNRLNSLRMVSMLIFGLSMIELFTVSAIHHIGRWREPVRRFLQSLDHASIFVLIAGTYTPFCVNVLGGSQRIALLLAIRLLAFAGIGLSIFARQVPRWRKYRPLCRHGLGGDPGVLSEFAAALSWRAVWLLLSGGLLYTIGAVIYARRRPDPFPSVVGVHEVFHLFVIAGAGVFAGVIWIWVLPLSRG